MNADNRERESVTLELTILAPAILLLLGLVLVAGRIQVAGGAVEQASAAAAREASITRTPTTATTTARAAAADVLDRRDLHCTTLTVSVDASGFAVPVGQPAQVAATVTCAVSVGQLTVPGLPGTKTMTARTASVLDTYRAR